MSIFMNLPFSKYSPAYIRYKGIDYPVQDNDLISSVWRVYRFGLFKLYINHDIYKVWTGDKVEYVNSKPRYELVWTCGKKKS